MQISAMSLDAQLTLTMKEIERYQAEIVLLDKDTLSSKEACERCIPISVFSPTVTFAGWSHLSYEIDKLVVWVNRIVFPIIYFEHRCTVHGLCDKQDWLLPSHWCSLTLSKSHRSLIMSIVFLLIGRLIQSIAATPERFGVPDDNPWQRADRVATCQCTIMWSHVTIVDYWFIDSLWK